MLNNTVLALVAVVVLIVIIVVVMHMHSNTAKPSPANPAGPVTPPVNNGPKVSSVTIDLTGGSTDGVTGVNANVAALVPSNPGQRKVYQQTSTPGLYWDGVPGGNATYISIFKDTTTTPVYYYAAILGSTGTGPDYSQVHSNGTTWGVICLNPKSMSAANMANFTPNLAAALIVDVNITAPPTTANLPTISSGNNTINPPAEITAADSNGNVVFRF